MNKGKVRTETIVRAAPPMARRGLMLVLSSPSGAGKTTISRELLKREGNLVVSISATTRPRRPGEVDGKDYVFVADDEFERMAEQGEFLEHATVFDHRYGTPRQRVEQALSEGVDILFDVDWQGTRQLRLNARADLVSVFILPPSMEELERRLYDRAQDAEQVVRKRMSRAASEISHYTEYDYVIVNTDMGDSVAAVQAILRAERLRLHRHVGLPDFVQTLGITP